MNYSYTYSFTDVTELKNRVLFFPCVKYGEEDAQTFDLCLPKNKTGKNGGIILVHGGAWRDDDASVFHNAMLVFAARKELACASVNYRLLPQGATCRDMLTDINSAISVFKKICLENGFSVRKIGIGGVSAGAHLALLYAYGKREICPAEIAFAFSFAGPTDFTSPDLYNMPVINKEEMQSLARQLCKGDNLTDISPLSFTDKNTVPTIIAHGEKDDCVPISQSESLAEKLTSNGVKNRFFRYPDCGHDFACDEDVHKNFLSELDEYINRFL